MARTAACALSLVGRAYQAAAAPGSATAVTAPFTVASYNILADKYATGGMHAYCPAQYLEWGYRRSRVLQQLLALDADLLCLQEVERPFFEGELEPLMRQHGYEGLYYGRARRPADPVAGPEDGIALLYRADRFERRASRAVRFASLVDPAAPGRCWRAVRDKEDGALLALLLDRQAGRELLAGCTHLHWDPRLPDVKAVQAQLLCAAVARMLAADRLAARYGGTQSAVPVVLGGDFNSLPFKRASDAFDQVPEGGQLVSGVYELLSSGRLDPGHHDHPIARAGAAGAGAGSQARPLHASGLRLRSALAAALGSEPPLTTKTAAFAGTLDYIWTSDDGRLVPVGALSMPAELEGATDPSEAAALGPLPDAQHPSDHLPIAVQLAWTAPAAEQPAQAH